MTTTVAELLAEKNRLTAIGAGWHALDDMTRAEPEPVPEDKPKPRKPRGKRAAGPDPTVAEQRRAAYEKRAGRREIGTLQR